MPETEVKERTADFQFGTWYPIATCCAPYCERPMLLNWRHCPEPSIGSWCVDEDYDRRPPGWGSPEQGWRCEGDQCIPRNQRDCTHWMPLPAKPEPNEGVKAVNSFPRWQPIATAPKDRPIIVAVMNTYSQSWTVGEAYWHESEGEWWWANISPGDYTGDSILNMNGPVEFWQPMPCAPEARTALSDIQEE